MLGNVVKHFLEHVIFNKLTIIDHKFHHNIVQVAVDPRGDNQVDLQTTLTMVLQNSLSITGQMHEKLMSICFFMITTCQIVRSRLLPHRINYKFMWPAY